MKKLLILSVVFLSFAFCIQSANANSKCHSVSGKADALCTSGAINPKVTQANIRTTICVSGYTAKIRPSTSYTNKLKKQQIKDYGYSDTKLADYEEDHLIPLEIGGNPTDPRNLWPEPHIVAGNKGSFTKDKLENSLHASVCKGTMTLQVAQNKILSLWDSVAAKTKPTQSIFPTTATPTINVDINVVNTSSTTVNQNSATALCNDGTYSYAVHHQGACSKHGGVKEFYK